MGHRRKRAAGKAQVVALRPGEAINGILFNVREDLRLTALRSGLSLMQTMFEEEVAALCGPRYEHQDGDAAYRWGRQAGVVVYGGQKISVTKPRVRRGGKEIPLRTYESLQAEDPLDERALEQMTVGVSTRKYGRSVESPEPQAKRSSVSRSAVSRRFVAMSEAQLEKALSVPLGDRQWVALMVDGIEFAEHVVVVALGVDLDGQKHVLGLREGSTENATLCRELLSDLVARGFPADQSLLVVIDGGKGLRKAVTQVFGQYAMVHRCQVHKRRNVLDQLPDERRAHARSVLEQAYAPSASEESALKQLRNLERSLRESHPGAAASILEGLEETLTIKQLALPEMLARSLATTNAIENINGTIRQVAGRVKRWRTGKMVLRWVATGTFEAQRGFRRVRGHKEINVLWKALRQRDDAMRGDKLEMVG
jgi:putative transposase